MRLAAKVAFSELDWFEEYGAEQWVWSFLTLPVGACVDSSYPCLDVTLAERAVAEMSRTTVSTGLALAAAAVLAAVPATASGPSPADQASSAASWVSAWQGSPVG